jgi:hypothetical protein
VDSGILPTKTFSYPPEKGNQSFLLFIKGYQDLCVFKGTRMIDYSSENARISSDIAKG